eukprot:307989-Prorocentrum_minimum.AAC.4
MYKYCTGRELSKSTHPDAWPPCAACQADGLGPAPSLCATGAADCDGQRPPRQVLRLQPGHPRRQPGVQVVKADLKEGFPLSLFPPSTGGIGSRRQARDAGADERGTPGEGRAVRLRQAMICLAQLLA